MTPVHIETERLIIREFSMCDWQFVHSYAVLDDVVRYMEWGPNTEKETRDFVKMTVESQENSDRTAYDLAVVEKSTGKMVGATAIYIKSQIHKVGEMGYVFHPDAWGKGYATEVTKAILEFGFQTLDLHRIQATCDVLNEASAHVLRKSGMTFEGNMRDNMFVRGRYRTSSLYSILEPEN